MDLLIVTKLDDRGVNQIRGRELMQYSKGKDTGAWTHNLMHKFYPLWGNGLYYWVELDLPVTSSHPICL